jgi:hypothetical protein
MLEEITGINRERVHKILVEDLKKKCVLVLYLLCQCQIKNVSAASFVEIIDDNRNVLKRIVMGDESWCFMYNPETKHLSKTWLSPKKPKAQKMRMQKCR